MNKKNKIIWAKEPRDHDYPAVASYLSLIYPPSLTKKLVEKLRRAPMTQFHAKDVFRASGPALLGPRNFHVKKVRAKIARGREISPIMLVRNKRNGKVVIAEGASHFLDTLSDCPVGAACLLIWRFKETKLRRSDTRAENFEFAGRDVHVAPTERGKLGTHGFGLRGESPQSLRHRTCPKSEMRPIADGYHRMCAVYPFDEDAIVPCKIV